MTFFIARRKAAFEPSRLAGFDLMIHQDAREYIA